MRAITYQAATALSGLRCSASPALARHDAVAKKAVRLAACRDGLYRVARWAWIVVLLAAALPLQAQVVRVSVAGDGSQASKDSYEAAISDDGQVIAFASNAPNLVAGDSNGWSDVFVRDLGAGTTERVSLKPDGQQNDYFSRRPSLSDDGKVVVFQGKWGGIDVVAATDRTSGTTTWLLPRAAGPTTPVQPVVAQLEPVISGNGQFVVFHTASDLNSGQELVYPPGIAPLNDDQDAGSEDVFVYDRTTSPTPPIERVSRSAGTPVPAAGFRRWLPDRGQGVVQDRPIQQGARRVSALARSGHKAPASASSSRCGRGSRKSMDCWPNPGPGPSRAEKPFPARLASVPSFTACAVPSLLGEVAAVAHAAPAPQMIAAAIHEQPAAGVAGAHAQPEQVVRDKKVHQRARGLPQWLLQVVRRSVHHVEAFPCRDDRQVRMGLPHAPVDRVEIGWCRRVPRSHGGQYAPCAIAEAQRALQDPGCLVGTEFGLLEQASGFVVSEQAAAPEPEQQFGIAPQLLDGIGTDAIGHGIDEIQARRAADQFGVLQPGTDVARFHDVTSIEQLTGFAVFC